MRNATHEAVGAAGAIGVCAAAAAPPVACAVTVIAALYASWLPDVDEGGARIHRRTRLERRHWPVLLLGTVLRIPLRLLARASHRGFTHWIATGLLVAGAAGALTSRFVPAVWVPITAGVACGYLLHLLADACTPAGAPLLGPFTTRRVHLLPRGWRIVTGGAGDTTVMLLALAAAAVVVSSQV